MTLENPGLPWLVSSASHRVVLHLFSSGNSQRSASPPTHKATAVNRKEPAKNPCKLFSFAHSSLYPGDIKDYSEDDVIKMMVNLRWFKTIASPCLPQRQHWSTWRRIHHQFYHLLPASQVARIAQNCFTRSPNCQYKDIQDMRTDQVLFQCCTPAVMYSVPNLPPLLEYLLNDPTNSPVDLAISRYRNTFGPPGFLLQPNIVSHIGRISSTGPPKPLLEYLYNMGLWNFSTADFCYILVYVQATILVVERKPYHGVDSSNLQSPILSKGSCCLYQGSHPS